MVLVERLKRTLEVSGFSVLSAGLGKPVTISPSRLSTLPFGILVLLDRLGGALDVTGFSVMSSEWNGILSSCLDWPDRCSCCLSGI